MGSQGGPGRNHVWQCMNTRSVFGPLEIKSPIAKEIKPQLHSTSIQFLQVNYSITLVNSSNLYL